MDCVLNLSIRYALLKFIILFVSVGQSIAFPSFIQCTHRRYYILERFPILKWNLAGVELAM